jgi:hypothetical protein
MRFWNFTESDERDAELRIEEEIVSNEFMNGLASRLPLTIHTSHTPLSSL